MSRNSSVGSRFRGNAAQARELLVEILRARSGFCRHCGGSGKESDATPVQLEFSMEIVNGLGCDPSTISKIASGTRAPSVLTALLIADQLNVTVDRLVKNPKTLRVLFRGTRAA